MWLQAVVPESACGKLEDPVRTCRFSLRLSECCASHDWLRLPPDYDSCLSRHLSGRAGRL